MNKVVSPEVQNFVNNIFNEYIEKDTWEVKENSNCIFSFGGLNKHVLSKTTKIFVSFRTKLVFNSSILFLKFIF